MAFEIIYNDQYKQAINSETSAFSRILCSTSSRAPHEAAGNLTHAQQKLIVRINDLGPFAKGRAIDLSSAAARAIGMGGTGNVRMEVIR